MSNGLVLTKAEVGLQGRYRLEVRKAKTNEIVRETDWFDNLITNTGLDMFGTGSGLFPRCAIGTGTNAPDVTDVQLQTWSATTGTASNNTGNLGVGQGYVGYRLKMYRFTPGMLNGNYSEIGVGWNPSSNNAPITCFSRALIVDGGGNPTTITVLSDEYLDVYYELRCVPPLTDSTQTGVVITNAGTFDVTRRIGNVGGLIAPEFAILGPYSNSGFPTYWNVSSNALQPITVFETNGDVGTAGYTVAAYVNGSYERVHNGVLPIGTAGTIRRFSLHSNIGCMWQFEFNPTFSKTSIQQLNFSTKLSWARV